MWISAWAPVVGWAALIFWMSSIPSLNSGLEFDFLLRKIAHMAEFGILAGLCFRGLRKTWPQVSVKKWILVSFFFSFLYALSDEWHQGHVPGRTAAAADVIIDSVGIMAVLTMIWIHHKRVK